MAAPSVKIMRARTILDKSRLGESDRYARPERRAFRRYPSSLHARLVYGTMIYAGRVTNLSQNGMFVSTWVRFPVNAEFMVVLLLHDRTVQIPIRIRRAVRNGSDCRPPAHNGIGVEILKAPQSYLDHVGQYR
ncbi:MAG: PilZ domain-containing protein [Nitrospiraceae bacterium]|nr:MAG: PilZ domain-containing protein [Nitrospiraceae bacterium]